MDEFMKKAAVIAGAGIALGVGVGVATSGNTEQAPHTAEAPQFTPDVVKALIESHYEQAAVVGEIEVVQGTNLLDEAEKIVADTLGQDVYKENKEHLYPFLRETSLYYTTQAGPHPGDIAHILQGDWDNNPENGHEYIVVIGSDSLTQNETNQVPSPTQIDPIEDTQLETIDR